MITVQNVSFNSEHAIQRARERYDLHLTPEDLVALLQRLLDGAEIEALPRHGSSGLKSIIEIEGKKVIVWWSARLRKIHSFLPG